MVLDALATLPPRARAVVVLRYWADMSAAIAGRRRHGIRLAR
jgi:DNA-directed RNA polymerase specialized sigma24 family protein